MKKPAEKKYIASLSYEFDQINSERYETMEELHENFLNDYATDETEYYTGVLEDVDAVTLFPDAEDLIERFSETVYEATGLEDWFCPSYEQVKSLDQDIKTLIRTYILSEGLKTNLKTVTDIEEHEIAPTKS